MLARYETRASKQAALMVAATLTIAFATLASSAAASTSRVCVFAATHVARIPAPGADVDRCDGTRPPVIVTAATSNILARLDTSGLRSARGALALVDASGHVVTAKGSRVGGRTSD